jgi:hypothetical protein
MLLLSDGINNQAALNMVQSVRKYNRQTYVSRVRSEPLLVDDISLSISVHFIFNKNTGNVSELVYLRYGGHSFYYSKNKSLDDVSHAKEQYLKQRIYQKVKYHAKTIFHQ